MKFPSLTTDRLRIVKAVGQQAYTIVFTHPTPSLPLKKKNSATPTMNGRRTVLRDLTRMCESAPPRQALAAAISILSF